MATIDRDGVRIHYEVHGEGPALLLSHAYASSMALWRRQVDTFAPAWRVIVWDMRGHGASDSPEDPTLYSEAETVADMAAILDALGVHDAVIGGLSLGGYMSLAFHLRHPSRTRGLMLFDTGPGYRSDAARADWNVVAERRARRFETRGLEALPRSDEVSVARHRSARGLALAARGMLAQVDARVINSLPRIAVPTLVLVGSEDEPYLAATDYMAAKIPGAVEAVVPGAGHAVNLHQPERFEAAVSDFLATI